MTESQAFDAQLPARCGDADLTPPATNQVWRWLATRLGTSELPAILTLDWTRCRWKPGISITCTYEARLDGGDRVTFAVKIYRDGKDRLLQDRAGDERCPAPPRGLHRRTFVSEKRAALWIWSADRALGGLRGVLDPRKLCRELEDLGHVPPRTLRRSTVRFELLRYKPERRAVLRVCYRLRDGEDTPGSLILRVRPPRVASTGASWRRSFPEAALPIPQLLGISERRGVVFEEDLPVHGCAPDSFDHGPEVGELLARLHRPAGAAPRPRGHLTQDLQLLGRLDPGLADDVAGLPVPRLPRRTRWIHGDVHPDQFARDAEGRLHLLDLDELAPGDRHADLASWIADRAARDPGADLETLGAPLLDAYRAAGGEALQPQVLRSWVAVGLVARASGMLRRLEPGAEEKVRRLVARARAIASEKGVRA